jgi:hypothetical protein
LPVAGQATSSTTDGGTHCGACDGVADKGAAYGTARRTQAGATDDTVARIMPAGREQNKQTGH